MYYEVKNRARGTLNADITDTDTSLTLNSGDGANFPSDVPFIITIDDEIMEVTATSSDTFTVTRGFEGTTASAHSAGAVVELRTTAELLRSTAGFKLGEYTGGGGTTTTIDWTKTHKVKFTFGAGDETLAFTDPKYPCNLVLMVVQDSTGGRKATWPSSVKWAGGSAPVLSTGANAIDIVSFLYTGDGNYHGEASFNFS